MRWDRLGMRLRTRNDQQRVETVCEVVAGGFNAMICGPDDQSWWDYCQGLEPHWQPFAREGASMGYALRHVLGPGRGRFEQNVVRAHPEGTYMYYVGRGLWHGMRYGKTARLDRETETLDAMYGMLCYDGFGFKYGFFDYGKILGLTERLMGLAGYRRRAAMQGIGRTLWFQFMNDADRLVAEIRRFDPRAHADLAAGLGLASVFVHTNALEAVWSLAASMPEAWRSDFQLGLSFGLRAREMNGPAYFEECLTRIPQARRKGIRQAMRECDRIEREVRASGQADGYRLWREGLTEWMDNNLKYPMEALTGESVEAA